eukprot:15046652-Alexandrium_andersonii.AAC.1
MCIRDRTPRAEFFLFPGSQHSVVAEHYQVAPCITVAMLAQEHSRAFPRTGCFPHTSHTGHRPVVHERGCSTVAWTTGAKWYRTKLDAYYILVQACERKTRKQLAHA